MIEIEKILIKHANTKTYTRPIHLFLNDGNVLSLVWNIKVDKFEYSLKKVEDLPDQFGINNECYTFTYDSGKIKIETSELLDEMISSGVISSLKEITSIKTIEPIKKKTKGPTNARKRGRPPSQHKNTGE